MKTSRQQKSERASLVVIGLFKLLKAGVLVGVALGVHHLFKGDVEASLERWAHLVRFSPNNRVLREAIAKLTGLSAHQRSLVTAGLLSYAALFATEGVGLLMGLRWAEWLTVVSTALLLPLEVRELFVRPTAVRWVILGLNAAVVVYLVVRLRRERRG
jgi:uncharacterized membrane protein (DUF2068 family)